MFFYPRASKVQTYALMEKKKKKIFFGEATKGQKCSQLNRIAKYWQLNKCQLSV